MPSRHEQRPTALPPHTRGCTYSIQHEHVQAPASPAHAGMYLPRHRFRSECRRFPRTRGDVPLPRRAPLYKFVLPPHTRGCTGHRRRPRHPLAASPAHAGMYLCLIFLVRLLFGFPRTRGDVPSREQWNSPRCLLPPHTRGCTHCRHQGDAAVDASPAHAGMYRRGKPAATTSSSFPRTRGDVPALGEFAAPVRELPPHTRGCTRP